MFWVNVYAYSRDLIEKLLCLLDTHYQERRRRERTELINEGGKKKSVVVEMGEVAVAVAEVVKDKNTAEMGSESITTTSRFKRICVFGGSSSGKRDCYQDAAVELGKELVSRKVDLVYGGGSIGLMGLVSQAVHQGGGYVLGIIPTSLIGKELTGETIGELKAVSGMHQRKAEMSRQSDAFIALPGGYGTMEELLEVISWAQLGIHNKPVGLLNVDGYYNSLLDFIDKAVDDGFIKSFQRHIIISAPNAKDLVQKLEEYVPVQDGAVAKLRWEIQHAGYNSGLLTEIGR